MSDRIQNEKRIARRLIQAGLDRGFTVSVNDGEEWTVKFSQDINAIMGALASTDMDTVRFRYPTHERVGDFLLIWGNGEDVVSDHTDNELCRALFDAATASSPLGGR